MTMTKTPCAASLLAACLLFCAYPAAAAGVVVQVTDAGGVPVKDAVAYAEPVGEHPPGTPKGAVIDQINKEFVPRVNVMQAGAAVTFPNKDDIRHHVYSFSAAKTFELKLYSGIPARPVVFDKPGTVVLGCNIHDRMVAYVLVVDTPYYAKTDDSGRARLENLPAGDYEIKAWQPLASGGATTAAQRVKIGNDAGAIALTLKAAPAR
jgi:plastocyanin